jgi:hypothetical protein
MPYFTFGIVDVLGCFFALQSLVTIILFAREFKRSADDKVQAFRDRNRIL